MIFDVSIFIANLAIYSQLKQNKLVLKQASLKKTEANEQLLKFYHRIGPELIVRFITETLKCA